MMSECAQCPAGNVFLNDEKHFASRVDCDANGRCDLSRNELFHRETEPENDVLTWKPDLLPLILAQNA